MNKDCVINPKTGRAVKISSVAGKKVIKTDPTPTHDCVINPKTGRAVKKSGAVGKKIINASSTITQAIKGKIARKTVEKAKEDAKPKKKEDTNRLHNLPEEIQKQIMGEVYKDGWDFSSVYGNLKASPEEFSKAVGLGDWGYDSFADYMKKPEKKKLIEAMNDSIKKNDGLLGYEWTEKDILKGKEDDESQEAIKLINKQINKDIKYSQKMYKLGGGRETLQQIRKEITSDRYVVIRFPNGYLLTLSASKVNWDLKQFSWGNSIKVKNKIIKYKKYEYRDGD